MQSRQNGLRDRGDDADLAGAVRVAPALGDLAAVVGVDRLERQLGGRSRSTISRGGHDVVHAPAVGGADVHVLDEAQDVAGAAEAARHRQRSSWSLTPRLTTMLILIGASPAAAAASMPSSTRATGKSTSFIARNTVVVERVEADGDALAGRRRAAPRALRGEQRAVGGQREVEAAGIAASICDQALEVAAHQRLAAGEADLLDAVAAKMRARRVDLLEASAARCAAGTGSRVPNTSFGMQ